MDELGPKVCLNSKFSREWFMFVGMFVTNCFRVGKSVDTATATYCNARHVWVDTDFNIT